MDRKMHIRKHVLLTFRKSYAPPRPTKRTNTNWLNSKLYQSQYRSNTPFLEEIRCTGNEWSPSQRKLVNAE